MVDWTSPEVEERSAVVYGRLVSVIQGIYLWYFITTLRDVEIPLITRRVKFTFPFVPYLLGRYFFLAISNIVIFTSKGTPLVHCIVLDQLLAVFSNITASCSSTNLLLRPVALWKNNRIILGSLVLLSLGQWAFGLGATVASVRIKFGPHQPSCAGTAPDTPHPFPTVVAYYLYTLLFDTLILVYTLAGLWRQDAARSSPLWSILYKQGIWYLVVTSAGNIPMLVLTFLNLNGTMNIFFAVPSSAISVMASSAAVTSLLKLKADDALSRRIRAGPQHWDVAGQTETELSDKPDTMTAGNQLTTNIALASFVSTPSRTTGNEDGLARSMSMIQNSDDSPHHPPSSNV